MPLTGRAHFGCDGMGKSLEEYAARHPQPEPEAADTARRYYEAQQERERVDQLKASISHQLEQGTPPQYILYAAIRAIGILTHDEAWAEAGAAALDRVYEDLAQQSMQNDEAAIAERRLKEILEQYSTTVLRQLNSQLRKTVKLEKALQEAIAAVNAFEQD